MFSKGVGNISPNESIIYNHWLITFTLLKEGVPWDIIQEQPPEDIAMMLAILTVQKQQEMENQAKMQGLGR